MFIQVIEGKVRDANEVNNLVQRWARELEPSADGWLGITYGVTDDGMMVATARFESEEAARRNSDRPEQSAWWRDMEACFTEPPAFHDCDDVTLYLAGGSDDAGFVQIIQGTVRDRERVRTLLTEAADILPGHRPDVLGVTVATDQQGFFCEVVYFASEAEARVAEKEELPDDVRHNLDELMGLVDGATYLDLHQPHLMSRR